MHLCPRRSSDTVPCCNQHVFKLPMFDRMTVYPSLVTCKEEIDVGRSVSGIIKGQEPAPIDYEDWKAWTEWLNEAIIKDKAIK